jgi:hypothetical protein
LPFKVRLQDHFLSLTDPRRRKVTSPLINLVAIAVCAIVAGADDFVSIAAWGRQKRKWLEQFLDLSNDIPSHDRFHAVLAALGPAASATPTPSRPPSTSTAAVWTCTHAKPGWTRKSSTGSFMACCLSSVLERS